MIRNQLCSIACTDEGRNLRITDLKRGVVWTLDENTVVYCQSGPGTTKELNPLRPATAVVNGDTLRVTYRASDVAIDYVYQLCENYIEVSVVPPDNETVTAVSLPGSYRAAGESYAYVLPIMQGMLWRGGGEPHDIRLPESNHGGFTMAMIGALSEHGGLLVTAETRDDVEWWVGKSESGRYWATNLQTASLGSMRYTRQARIYLTDPTHTAVAKTYRAKVVEQGRFKSWEEKLRERPALERLFGTLMCFIGYCEDDLDYAAELQKIRDYGFDRVLVYPVRFNTYHTDIRMGGYPPISLSTEEVAAIKELGYDVSAWTWINEALDDGTDQIRSRYRIKADGERVRGWQIDEQVWYSACSSTFPDTQRVSLNGPLSDLTWDHLDVITAASLGECYALDHEHHLGRPQSRSEDRDSIRELLRVSQADGRPVSSEGFNDAYSMEYDIGSVKAWPMYGPWPYWPVPLTMLVYHDSMIHSWWEMHSYNNTWFGHTKVHRFYEKGGGRTRLQAAMDALYGSPPDVFPFGKQYSWTGRGQETQDFHYRFEDPEVKAALAAAKPVAELHRDIGQLEMLSHRFLSEDGYVQETIYKGGIRVVANFASDLRTVEGYDPLHGESWKVYRSVTAP